MTVPDPDSRLSTVESLGLVMVEDSEPIPGSNWNAVFVGLGHRVSWHSP